MPCSARPGCSLPPTTHLPVKSGARVTSSFHTRAVQSPRVRKYLGAKGFLWGGASKDGRRFGTTSGTSWGSCAYHVPMSVVLVAHALLPCCSCLLPVHMEAAIADPQACLAALPRPAVAHAHLLTPYTGPWWPAKLLPTRSAGFLALRLQLSTTPCSVPTMNLVGPAWAWRGQEAVARMWWAGGKGLRGSLD